MTYISQIEQAIVDVKKGKPIIIVDSMERENEGDLMLAAEKATPSVLAFIAKEARGLMCIPTAKFILDRLEIPMSPSNNNDRFSTPFSVSIDARFGVTTGVSVDDRMETIKLVLDDNTRPHEIAYPGHLFPLRPRPGLLEDRQGHTEGSIQLCLLAEMQPVAIISEIMNDNGSMARMNPDLINFSNKWGLTVISIDMIRDYSHATKWVPPIQVG